MLATATTTLRLGQGLEDLDLEATQEEVSFAEKLFLFELRGPSA